MGKSSLIVILGLGMIVSYFILKLNANSKENLSTTVNMFEQTEARLIANTGVEIYLEKLTQMISVSTLNSITVLVMQVPCCSGLFQIAKMAVENSGKNIPLKVIVIGIQGEVLQEVEV